MSTPARLLDSYGRPMAVRNGAPIVYGTGALSFSGADENDVARMRLIERNSGLLKMDVDTYASRSSAMNDPSVYSEGVRTFKTRSYFPESSGPSSLENTHNGFAGITDGITSASYAGPIASCDFQSSSADDAQGGTGARTFTLIYFGSDGQRYSKTILTNGTTAVSTLFNPPMVAIDRLFLTSAGSAGGLVGGFTAIDPISTFNLLYIGPGITELIPYYAVANSAVYITDFNGSDNAAAGSIIWVKATYFDYTRAADTSAAEAYGAINTLLVDTFKIAVNAPYNKRYSPPIKIAAPPAGCLTMAWTQLAIGSGGTSSSLSISTLIES